MKQTNPVTSWNEIHASAKFGLCWAGMVVTASIARLALHFIDVLAGCAGFSFPTLDFFVFLCFFIVYFFPSHIDRIDSSTWLRVSCAPAKVPACWCGRCRSRWVRAWWRMGKVVRLSPECKNPLCLREAMRTAICINMPVTQLLQYLCLWGFGECDKSTEKPWGPWGLLKSSCQICLGTSTKASLSRNQFVW